MSFFVEQQEDEIVFQDGWKAYIKHEMTAGDQEDLESFILANQGKPLQLGNLKMLELSLLRVVAPDGTETRITPSLVRQMERGRAARLINEVSQRNAPLDEVTRTGKTDGAPISTSSVNGKSHRRTSRGS